jgi:protein-S-isoprenylcysteine O-methyltransferase Ste14
MIAMMSIEHLRAAAFCAYLIAWLVLAVAAVAGGISTRRRQAVVHITVPVIAGALLQLAGALTITLSMGKGPLRPRLYELIGALVLAPLGAVLFCWALRSARSNAAASLVTSGPYAWMRHPIYAAFLAMLLATGLLTSAGFKLVVATVLYLAGSEFRIGSEEAELAEKFPGGYEQYRLRTRWRYLPGVR